MDTMPATIVDNYLIVLREVLIARDLAQTITERDPDAKVIMAVTPDDAVTAIAGIQQIAVAFVSSVPSEYAVSSLGPAIKARGGRVVLLGFEAEASGPTPDWDVLRQPFDTHGVLSVLGRVLG